MGKLVPVQIEVDEGVQVSDGARKIRKHVAAKVLGRGGKREGEREREGEGEREGGEGGRKREGGRRGEREGEREREGEGEREGEEERGRREGGRRRGEGSVMSTSVDGGGEVGGCGRW